MIIFNTIKKAEHYIKWYSKINDYERGGYDWESISTYISGDLVLSRHMGDGCGCGCDLQLYDYTILIGRIKAHDSKTIRDSKLKKIIE